MTVVTRSMLFSTRSRRNGTVWGDAPAPRLSDWPACNVELRCPCSPRVVIPPVRLLIQEHGDLSFRALVGRLRCSGCGGPPAPVYIVAGHNRTLEPGLPADWSILLVRPL